MRIDRSAWKRIKARVAQYVPITVSGLWMADGETEAEFRERVRQHYQTLTIDVEGTTG